jgi:hypothetical protein
MIDGFFYISSAINVNNKGIFSNEERFQQMVETVNSINKYCPNNQMLINDSAENEPEVKYVEELARLGANTIYTGNRADINYFSQVGAKSQAESLAKIVFLEWFKTQEQPKAKRYYKVSGRYSLTEDFKMYHEHENSFTFKKSVDSWMSEELRKPLGITKLYDTRLYHFDFNLLPIYREEMKNIFNDCLSKGIDIEHSYYKNLNKYNVIEVDKIGICGIVAPTGAYIDE